MRPQTATTPSPFDNRLLAGVLSVILPIRSIKRAWRRDKLWHAYVIHLFGVVAGLLGLAILDATFNRGRSLDDFSYIFGGMRGEELFLTIFSLLLTAGMFEAGVMVLAWILMPWGAAPEPWRRSMRRSLTRLLQLTPYFAFSLVLLVLCLVMIDDARPPYRYDSDPGLTSLSREMYDFFEGLCILIYGLSQIIVTLWAIPIHEDHPHWAGYCPWPAECEGCGYALMDITPGRGCPECGCAIEDTVNSPRSRDDPRSVLSKMFQATFFPYKFGKTIPLYRPTTDYRKALRNTFLCLLLTVPVGMIVGVLMYAVYDTQSIEFLWEDLFEDYGDLMIGYAFITSMTVFAAMGLGLLSATLWGAYARLFHKRNALYPAAQAFAYQSGFLVLWVLGFYPLAASVGMVMEYAYRHHGYGYSTALYQFMPMIFPAYFFLMAIICFTLHGRLLRGARHGNG